MHFIHYLVNPNLQKYAASTAGSDSVYFAVLEEYLLYFLPFQGTDPDPIPAPSPSSHYGSPIFSTPSQKPRYTCLTYRLFQPHHLARKMKWQNK